MKAEKKKRIHVLISMFDDFVTFLRDMEITYRYKKEVDMELYTEYRTSIKRHYTTLKTHKVSSPREWFLKRYILSKMRKLTIKWEKEKFDEEKKVVLLGVYEKFKSLYNECITFLKTEGFAKEEDLKDMIVTLELKHGIELKTSFQCLKKKFKEKY